MTIYIKINVYVVSLGDVYDQLEAILRALVIGQIQQGCLLY